MRNNTIKENRYITKLYYEQKNRLLSYVESQVMNSEDAADIVADTFLSFIERDEFMYSCRYDTHVRLLFRIAQRQCEMHAKRNERFDLLPLNEEVTYVACSPSYGESDDGMLLDHVYMEDMVGNLYGEERELVELYYLKGYSSHEVARMMEITMSCFYKKKERAIDKLRWFIGHT